VVVLPAGNELSLRAVGRIRQLKKLPGDPLFWRFCPDPSGCHTTMGRISELSNIAQILVKYRRKVLKN